MLQTGGSRTGSVTRLDFEGHSMPAADLEFAFADGVLGRPSRTSKRTSVELTRFFLDRLGLPAVPMLTGFAAAGTPTGAQLTGWHGDDTEHPVVADALLARLGPVRPRPGLVA